MGSFNFDCLLSRLSIGWNDKVRCVLLSEDPWGDNRGWRIQSLPLRSRYSDYGYVEGVEGLPAVLTLENLRRNLIELPMGDNSYHDLAINKTHDLDYLLKSIAAHSRDRVFLRAPAFSRGRIKVPKGIPTWKRVEKRLLKAGLTMKCDRLAYGVVRVRVPDRRDEGAETIHRQAGEVLQKHYRAESYHWSMENYWIVGPKDGEWPPRNPSLDNHNERLLTSFKYGGTAQTKYKAGYPVRQALIREDIWQGFLTIAGEETKNRHFDLGVKVFEEGLETLNHGGIPPEIRKYVEDSPRYQDQKARKLTVPEAVRAIERLGKSCDWILGSGPMSFSQAPNDLGATFAHMTALYHAGEIDRLQVNKTILDFAELFSISEVMYGANMGWEPCIPQGQERNWSTHARVCSLIDRVIKQAQKDEDC